MKNINHDYSLSRLCEESYGGQASYFVKLEVEIFRFC